jgi:CheY-like chemotaxis protein
MPPEPHRVLVVKEDATDRAVMRAVLSASGLDVTTTDSALSASQLVLALRPNVILLDLALTYRSGAAWLAELKADPRKADIPVLVVTALSDVLPDERRALAADVIAKPIHPRTLTERVRLACEQRALRNDAWAQERLSE